MADHLSGRDVGWGVRNVKLKYVGNMSEGSWLNFSFKVRNALIL